MNSPARAPTITEHELVARCQRGDRDAQRALYEQTCERVFRVLVRMTHSRDVAEDLAQETYVKAFSAIATFDERSGFSTWLYRIAVNEALQWLRRKSPTSLDPAVAASRSDPRHNGQNTETHLDVAAALDTLSPIDRAILLLRYQEGLDYKAISDVLEIAMGTVASRLNRAREQMRERLVDFKSRPEEKVGSMHPNRHVQEGESARLPAKRL
ncbi:MAG: DNA-directed RNA polymerase sigma-70 factor [Planctomycetota bacterium]